MKKSKVAIVGANGYSGEELCAILTRHPGVEIVAVTSRQHAGKRVGEVLARLRGCGPFSELKFQAPDPAALLGTGAEFFFLALPHGLAAEFAQPLCAGGGRVVDLSADFRLRSAPVYEEFYGEKHGAPELLEQAVYGIPELHREKIRTAHLVASAGCYPTSILLPLVPLLRAGLIEGSDIAVSSASGVSGAGRKADPSLLYGECNESLRAYGLPKHRHLSEIEQELSLAAGEPLAVTFVPHLAPMNRGIHTTIFTRLKAGHSESDAIDALKSAYRDEPFVRVDASLPDTKNVTGTNFCDIAVRFDGRAKRLILLAAEDNLVKGAAGQAVQNFNLMAGYPETTGLL
ncbi:MAG: N-acetyl-gamma-glutamyl-phosphate reductase [Terrimicrobiaceae bacterium]|nr:N-acetyl-gamma-glutamyl-phosphate reductase [Terrimicrobiaceae bacterium]